MRQEGTYSPPPPSYHATVPDGHQDISLANPPTYREDEQHLLPPGQEQPVNPNSRLIRLRNLAYQAAFWKWGASVVLLGLSASSVSEDGLEGVWLAAMAYSLFCAVIGVVAPIPLCPRSKTDAKPSARSLYVLGVSTALWLAAPIVLIVLDLTWEKGRYSDKAVYVCIFFAGCAFVLSLLQWYLVSKIWRGTFANVETAEVYKTTIRMYWESNDQELAPLVGTEGVPAGEGRNRILGHVYKSNGFGFLRVILSIVDIGITASAVTIGKDVFSENMRIAVALNLAAACLHVPFLFVMPLTPRSKTDQRPSLFKVLLLGFSTALWTAAVVFILLTTIGTDFLNVGDAKTIPGPKRRPISVPKLRTRLRGHGIAAACVGILVLLCNATGWYCVFRLWTGRFTSEEKADAFQKAGRTAGVKPERTQKTPAQEQELTSLAA